MSYDKELFDRIDRMHAGELVHYMLATFEPTEYPFAPYLMRDPGYSRAAERLGELLEPTKEAEGRNY